MEILEIDLELIEFGAVRDECGQLPHNGGVYNRWRLAVFLDGGGRRLSQRTAPLENADFTNHFYIGNAPMRGIAGRLFFGTLDHIVDDAGREHRPLRQAELYRAIRRRPGQDIFIGDAFDLPTGGGAHFEWYAAQGDRDPVAAEKLLGGWFLRCRGFGRSFCDGRRWRGRFIVTTKTQSKYGTDAQRDLHQCACSQHARPLFIPIDFLPSRTRLYCSYDRMELQVFGIARPNCYSALFTVFENVHCRRRTMARPRIGSNLSIAQLESILQGRISELGQLQKQHAKLSAELSAVEKKISELGGKASRGRGKSVSVTAGGRARNEKSLVATLEEVLGASSSPMRVGDIVDAVLKTGYQTGSDNFRGIVNQTLIKERKRFTSAGRGLYVAKGKK